MPDYQTLRGTSTVTYEEKRSRFIATAAFADTEEKALAVLNAVRAANRTARHNVYAYVLQNGRTRYSDDGEPQGTAGQPMLEVFRREGVENVCCVVTRYFGGILLGTGGLLRAYTKSAKDTLTAAGVAVVRQWADTVIECPYHLFERMKLEIAAVQGILGEIEYGAQVRIPALLPLEQWPAYEARVTELTAGQLAPELLGEVFKALPTQEPSV